MKSTLLKWFGITAVLLSGLLSASGPQKDLDHSRFEKLLERHVDASGWVSYTGLREHRTELNGYLESLAAANPSSFPSDRCRLAFWINAYNAYTVTAVLDHVDGKATGVKSVSGFFDRIRHRVAGQNLTLDEIETRAREFGGCTRTFRNRLRIDELPEAAEVCLHRPGTGPAARASDTRISLRPSTWRAN